MTNETLLSYIYILKNKEGKKKKNRRVRGPSSLGPHAWAWFYFYYYFIKMWTTCHSSLFLYIKKKNTDDVLSASPDSGHHCGARNIGATPFLVKKTQFLNHFNPKHTLLTPLEHP